MKKEEFLKIVDSLNLDKERYCIISGGVLVIRGIREETEDVDIKVPEDYFEELNSRFNLVQGKYKDLYVLSEDVEVTFGGFSKDKIETYEGYPLEKLDSILKWKMDHKRPKDERDIKLIQEYMEKNKE